MSNIAITEDIVWNNLVKLDLAKNASVKRMSMNLGIALLLSLTVTLILLMWFVSRAIEAYCGHIGNPDHGKISHCRTKADRFYKNTFHPGNRHWH